MTQNNSEVIPWAGVIVLRDRKVLTLQENDKSFILIPGGKREPGESDEETAKREIMEELGVGVNIGEEFLSLVEHSKSTGQMIRFLVFKGELLEEPNAAQLPGKTRRFDYVNSRCEQEGFELGNFSGRLIEILAEQGLID